jgi:hypothetical protein
MKYLAHIEVHEDEGSWRVDGLDTALQAHLFHSIPEVEAVLRMEAAVHAPSRLTVEWFTITGSGLRELEAGRPSSWYQS